MVWDRGANGSRRRQSRNATAIPDGGDPEPAVAIPDGGVVVRWCLPRMTAATSTTAIPDGDGGSIRGVAAAVPVGGENPSFPPALRHATGEVGATEPLLAMAPPATAAMPAVAPPVTTTLPAAAPPA
jgi:hypothetical protein